MLTVELAEVGFVIETIGAKHSLYLIYTVFVAVPQAFVAVKITSLFPFANGTIALTCPFRRFKLLTETPFTVKLNSCTLAF